MGHTEKFPLKLRLCNGENYIARKKEESNVRNITCRMKKVNTQNPNKVAREAGPRSCL